MHSLQQHPTESYSFTGDILHEHLEEHLEPFDRVEDHIGRLRNLEPCLYCQRGVDGESHEALERASTIERLPCDGTDEDVLAEIFHLVLGAELNLLTIGEFWCRRRGSRRGLLFCFFVCRSTFGCTGGIWRRGRWRMYHLP